MKIAVVILNWNGREFLEQFLPSVVNYSYADAEIVVADNASTDDSMAFLKKNYPSIRIVQNTKNFGFARGYNEALKHIKAEYYVLLNSDIEVTPRWIEPIIDLMDADKNIAVCQPKIKSFYRRDYFEYAGASGGFIDNYGYPFCRGRIFNELEEDKSQYDDIMEIFWATGACLFIRSELFHKLNGFDEDFFAHMEEIDLCWQLKKQGYKIMVCPKSVVYHVGGGTLQKNNPQKTFYNFRNSLYTLIKNAPRAKLIPCLLIRLILDFIAGIKFLFTSGRFSDALAIIKAHRYVFFKFLSLLKKRKIILSQSITSAHLSSIYKKSIVIEHYLRNKKKFSELDKDFFA